SSDMEQRSKVCLITKKVADRDFGLDNPIGGSIRMGELSFTVIGVFRERVSTFGLSEIKDESVIIPQLDEVLHRHRSPPRPLSSSRALRSGRFRRTRNYANPPQPPSGRRRIRCANAYRHSQRRKKYFARAHHRSFADRIHRAAYQ